MPSNPYKQSIPLEMLRMGVFFVTLAVTGVLASICASATAALISERFEISVESLGGGAAFGAGWGAFAIAPLWHRPLFSGWAAITIPACGLAALLGFVIGAEAGMAGGVLVMPLAGLWAQRRLPFAFPRYPPGQCPVCGYELERLRSRRCPECGSDVLAAPQPESSP